MLKGSKYNILFKKFDNKYIYNTVSGNYSLVPHDFNLSTFNEYLENNNFSNITEMINQGFVVDAELDETKKLIDINYNIRKNSDFLCLNLIVTRECNFNCSYCFENRSCEYMNENIIDNIINFTSNYVKYNSNCKKIIVFWFGGEPLLNIDFIKKMSEKFIEFSNLNNINYSSRIITNGYLLNTIIDDIASLKLTDIQITIDGNKALHNIRRPHISDGDTFDTILNNIYKLMTHNVDLIIRTNIDSSNIDDSFSFLENLKNIKNELDTSPKARLFFYPALVENYTEKVCSRISSCANLQNNENDLYSKYSKLKKLSNSLDDSTHYIKAACNIQFPGTFVIDPSGFIYKCWGMIEKKDNAIGTLLDFNFEKNHKYNNLITSSPIKQHSCTECKFMPLCMGGCYVFNSNKEFCNKKRKLLVKNILETITN